MGNPETGIRIGVVAHLNRTPQAEQLAGQTNADYIAYDDGSLGCEENHRRVWNRLSKSPSAWSVVLEDDAIPQPGFPNQLEKALAAAPSPVVSLYLGRLCPPQWQRHIETATQKADANEAHWIQHTHLLHAVGVAIRTDLLPSLLNCYIPLPWDESISWWARHHGHPISYTWPSLIDHADTDTLLRHRDKLPRPKGRIAHRVGTRDQWTGSAVIM